MDGMLVAKIVMALVILQMMLGIIAYLILLERKTAAWIQDRDGADKRTTSGQGASIEE